MLLAIIIFAVVLVIAVVLLVKFGPWEYTANARKIFRTYSLWLGVTGTAVTGFLASFPQYALDIWSNLPPEIKSSIPPDKMPLVGAFFFVLSMVSKFVSQKKLENNNGNSS